MRESAEWYDRLPVPEGAVDPFHAVRFDSALVRSYAEAAELRVIDIETDSNENVFVRAARR